MKTIFAPLQQKRLRICGMVTALALAAGLAGAQSPAIRIRSEISNSEQSRIQGSLHPMAQAKNDAGRLPADTRLNGISLYFNRSAAQEADLQALLAAQQNPASPLYHQWLTPEQFAARFGMSSVDIDQVQAWLQQQGFSIDSVSRSRNLIRFSGTVNQVELAFSTQMHYYQSGGTKFFAPSTELSVPAAIAPTVAGIRNLTSYRLKPQHITAGRAHPSYTTAGSTQYVYFAPGDISTVYDITPLSSASINGAGQTIVVAGQSAIVDSDIENFQSAAGLPTKDPTMVLMPGTGDSTIQQTGDEGESDLDVEWSGAVAKGANIVFVYTGGNSNYGVFDSIQYAVDEMIAPIITVSYGSCETELSSSDVTSLETITAQAGTQGQTIVAASGDQGSTGCSGYTGLTTAQQEALAVNYPASSPNVTGLGGTEISSTDAQVGTYWLAASTSSTGADLVTSATQYIPEIAWNDDALSVKYGGGLSSSGGGASTLFSKPSWQTGVAGIPSDSKRDVPDLALYSSPNYPGYLYCTSDPSDWNSTQLPYQQASCNSGFYDSSSGDLTAAGGTSFATPIFAGILALINQKAGYVTGQGNINSTLYKLASNSTTYAAAFHDVTSGNNDCLGGTALCGSSQAGFSAGTGYDQVTGLGSVDVDKLAGVWPTNTGASASLVGTEVTVTPASTTPTINTADTFTITVAPDSGSGVPTGTVTLQIDGGTDFGGTTIKSQTLASNGTLTYSATFTTAGNHQVLAQYSGNSTYAASTGVGSVTITATSSGKGTIALAATNLTVTRGTSGASTVTVTPAGGYTGTVLLTFDTSNDTALANICYEFSDTLNNGDGSVAVTGTSAATTQLTLDTNASDCATTAAIAKTGKRPLHLLRAGSTTASRNPATNPVPAGLAFAGLLLIGFLGRSSRKFRNLVFVLALAAGGLALSACGSSSGGTTTISNPPKGTYTITVSGQDSVTSTITATTTFSFVID